MKSKNVNIKKSAILIFITLATATLQTLFIINDQMLLMFKPFEGIGLILAFMLPAIASIISTMFSNDDEKHSIMIRNTIILYLIIMAYFIFQVVMP